jgi:hypothetical protein
MLLVCLSVHVITGWDDCALAQAGKGHGTKILTMGWFIGDCAGAGRDLIFKVHGVGADSGGSLLIHDEVNQDALCGGAFIYT